MTIGKFFTYVIIIIAGLIVLYTIEGAATLIIGFSKFEDTPILIKLSIPLIVVGTLIASIITVSRGRTRKQEKE